MLKLFLESGIGVHHAGMLPILKEMVEILFSQGKIKVLFATTTFAIGVNMPARSVAFLKTKKIDNNGELKILDSSEYLQMAGRAGRRGKDDIGTVVIYSGNENELPDMKELKSVLEGKGIALESKFKVTYKMMLHLLQSERINVSDVMHFSYGRFNNIKSVIGKYTRKCELENCLNQGTDLGCSCEEAGNEIQIIEQLYRMNQTIASANDHDLVPGRIITVLRGEYIGAKAVIIEKSTKNKSVSLDIVVLAKDEPKYREADQGLVRKFKGFLESGEYYEYLSIGLENVLQVINFIFKHVIYIPFNFIGFASKSMRTSRKHC